MATAKKPKPEKVPARQAAEVVLRKAGRPMHYREITREAIEQGIIRVPKGRRLDPDRALKTIRSYLCAEEGTKFERVDTGVFTLRKADEAAAKVAEKAEVKP